MRPAEAAVRAGATSFEVETQREVLCTMSTDSKITLQELAEISTRYRCELVRGEVVYLTPTGGIHGSVESRIARVLGNEGEDCNLGLAFAGDVGIIVDAVENTVRGADNAFVTSDQLPVRYSPEGYLLTIPALVVEVLSPNDRASDVQEKVLEYLAAGARVVWVMDPANKVVTVHQRERDARVLTESDPLWAPGVLPDLRARVGKLFAGIGEQARRPRGRQPDVET